MPNKKLIISIILTAIITAAIFLSPVSLSTSFHCFCGGCCVGCPGDCQFTIGAPFTYYYSGINGIAFLRKGPLEPISQFSLSALIADIIVWGILIILIYKFVYRKKSSPPTIIS